MTKQEAIEVINTLLDALEDAPTKSDLMKITEGIRKMLKVVGDLN